MTSQYRAIRSQSRKSIISFDTTSRDLSRYKKILVCVEHFQIVASICHIKYAKSRAFFSHTSPSDAVFEISAILLRAGPGRLGLKIPPGRADLAENFSGPGRADLVQKFLRAGPGRLGLKIPPGRADLAENFSGPGRLGPKIPPSRAGPTWAENSSGPGRFPKNKFDIK